MPEPITIQRGELWGIDFRFDNGFPIVRSRLPVVFSEIDLSSITLLTGAVGEGSYPEIRDRFQQGKRCFIGLVEGALACWGWISHGDEWIGEMKVNFRMEPGESYIWDCVTLPEYRRQGLFSALINYMARDLQKEGVVRVWIGSNLENRPSIKGFDKAGYRPVIRVLFVQVLGLRFFKISRLPGAPPGLVKEVCRAFDTGRAIRRDKEAC
jgi:GNAT superfamily N-acetyltransferase